MSHWPEHLAGITTHARRGEIAHVFRHRVDYVLIDPESRSGPMLFSRNGPNLASVHDRTHGGPRGQGRGAAWARETLQQAGAPGDLTLRLLAQPRFFGFWFDPVSFWLGFAADGTLRAVIAEVSNTFNQRHSYLCALPDFAPITPEARISTRKLFHVSPFQDIAGNYSFTFDITPGRIDIKILLNDEEEGVFATLSGPLAPLTNRRLLVAALARPLGPLRTLVLIYWHALRLKLKGAAYRQTPPPPQQEISR